MEIEGRVIKDFVYTVVMGSNLLGNFVIYPGSGDFANQTVAVAVYKETQVSIGGITRPAAEFDLPELIKFPLLATVDLIAPPQKIDTGGSWNAIAQYSADAQKVTLTL